jgi:hypothetical protein
MSLSIVLIRCSMLNLRCSCAANLIRSIGVCWKRLPEIRMENFPQFVLSMAWMSWARPIQTLIYKRQPEFVVHRLISLPFATPYSITLAYLHCYGFLTTSLKGVERIGVNPCFIGIRFKVH